MASTTAGHTAKQTVICNPEFELASTEVLWYIKTPRVLRDRQPMILSDQECQEVLSIIVSRQNSFGVL
jgi:hypothetical protein